MGLKDSSKVNSKYGETEIATAMKAILQKQRKRCYSS